MYFCTFALPLTANSPVSGICFTVIFLLFESTLSSVTVKFDTAVGRVWRDRLERAQRRAVRDDAAVDRDVVDVEARLGEGAVALHGRVVDDAEGQQHALARIRRQAARLRLPAVPEKPVKPGSVVDDRRHRARGRGSDVVPVVPGEARVGSTAVGRHLHEPEVPRELSVSYRLSRGTRAGGRVVDRHGDLGADDRVIEVVTGPRVERRVPRLCCRRTSTVHSHREGRAARWPST